MVVLPVEVPSELLSLQNIQPLITTDTTGAEGPSSTGNTSIDPLHPVIEEATQNIMANIIPATPAPTDIAQPATTAIQSTPASRLLKRRASYISPAATALAGAQPRRASAPSLPVMIYNELDKAIDRFLDPPELRPLVDPKRVLSGNFAPVPELPPTRCRVVRGSIPPCLAGGAYIRNGPNPQHHLPGRTYHLFDGDGMLHPPPLLPAPSSTLFSDPVLCSSYVHTNKYLLEREARLPVFPNYFAGLQGVAGLARALVMTARSLTGQINMSRGFGLANTSVILFMECTYALWESDLPYAVRINPSTGEVTTLGRSDFDDQLTIGMTAHPKKDPVTGELFAFRYIQSSVMHDFAITERYAIFPERQLIMKPTEYKKS
ncbi:hypothetical protein E2562_032271 [Oryza meyeriana var. granulata]|uniref:Uncharacterized protein n=1 Tax=Oryza meyeriana var. granulata TaxID=110450 RepID=A0A6G1F0I3_9ORYZ|nr:hypothetical protein E2562_032271 [Oryza meyeriana var. granulata]